MPMEVLAEWSDKDPIKRASFWGARGSPSSGSSRIRERVRGRGARLVQQAEEDEQLRGLEEEHIGV